MKFVTIVGARPQFIKAAVVSRAVRTRSEAAGLSEVLVHTGQHYDHNMSDVFFDQLDIPRPAYNLGVGSAGHGAMTGRMLEKIEEVLAKESPDGVVVYGDTNSTLAGALAASKMGLNLAHVEAGLRSYNFSMPEEQNRLVADRLAGLLFCPTDEAVRNLEQEGVAGSAYGQKAILTGDVMYDAALFYSRLSRADSSILTDLGLEPDRFVLATVHRAENTDDPRRLAGITAAITQMAADGPVVLPVHPRTRKRLAASGGEPSGVTLIDPVPYLDMIALESACRLVVTDSGGVQKEAYFFQKPCLTVREETEWVELVRAGVNLVVGAETDRIMEAYRGLDPDRLDFGGKFYGDGRAGEKIVDILASIWGDAQGGAAV